MLLHRLVSLVCIFAMLTLAFLAWRVKTPIWWLVIPAIIWLGLTSWGAFDLRLNYFTSVFYKAKTSQKVIALTFDDGPTEHTKDVLKLLRKYNAKATFFCIGHRFENQDKVVNEIIADGHLIGNHTYSHSAKTGFFSTEEILAELDKTDALISVKTAKPTTYFRPPFGVTNPNIARAIQKRPHEVIGWSIRSLDTVIDDEERILRRVLPKIAPGEVILLHDTSTKTVKVLEQILKVLHEQSYQMVTIEELKKYENESESFAH
ncbi:polysaccharide deacetylase family protein [Vaginella massiliensis]|uniref:polysaccharide deacetylase family protein n=1 Tax=Vaginella massiliensis TaxID=1816680 RepID=UPI0037519DB4